MLLDNSKTWKEELEYGILVTQEFCGTETESGVINIPQNSL